VGLAAVHDRLLERGEAAARMITSASWYRERRSAMFVDLALIWE